MSGPRVQFSVSEMFDFQYDGQGRIIGANLKPEAATFLQSVQQITYALTRSGPTASRPTSTFPNRWVGMNYFDTTLGLPVWLKTASTNVWVDATGAPV